jgi:hypothetical protein
MVINAYVDEWYAEPRTFALGCAMARGMDLVRDQPPEW